jgi:hypothetical protein
MGGTIGSCPTRDNSSVNTIQMGKRETRAAHANMLLAEGRIAQRLKAAVRLWARAPSSGSVSDAVARSAAIGALDSWHDGADSGRIDIAWLGEKLDKDIPAVDVGEPAWLISRRAAAVGLSYERAFIKAKAEAQRDKARNPIARAMNDTLFRLDRIATTENAIQFTTARRTIVATAVAAALIPLSKVVQVWDAMLDACLRCRGLHGQKTNLGGSWDGQLPGSVHANCRCIDTFEVQ